MLDLAIIGSGPAALTAAIYAARGQLEVTVFERGVFGGLLNEIAQLDNFPGFSGPGPDFAKKLKLQAKESGAKLQFGECTRIERQLDGNLSLTIDGREIHARAVLVATGSEPRQLELDATKPISYCSLCDGPLYQGKKLLVVGGGNSAVGESIHLASLAAKVTLISRAPLSAEPALVSRLRACQNVEIFENTPLDSSRAQAALAETDGIFAFIGHTPATGFLSADLLDAEGYIIAPACATKLPGLFAAGDVRSGALRQAITAAADGATAAVSIQQYLS